MKVGLKRRLLRRGPLRDCGGPREPRYRDKSFLGEEVSPDQAAIEAKLPDLLGRADHWLHVGIGGSRIARCFAAEVGAIDGITVMADELVLAESLGLQNYHPRFCDKYGPELSALVGPYHLIIDNNPSSFACCLAHFDRLMSRYATMLSPGGLLLSASRGMAFCEPYAFGLRPFDLWRAGRPHGLRLVLLGDTVYGLRRG